MGSHLRVLSESYPMDTNMTGFRWFSKILLSCALDDSIVSVLEGLRFEMCLKLTELLPGGLRTKEDCYILAKFPKLTVVI